MVNVDSYEYEIKNGANWARARGQYDWGMLTMMIGGLSPDLEIRVSRVGADASEPAWQGAAGELPAEPPAG